MVIRSIRDVLSGRKPLAVHPETTIAHASEVMARQAVSAILVIEDGHLLGILSEWDVIQHVSQHGGLHSVVVQDIMSRDVQTIRTRDSLSEALSRMLAGGVRHLPVIDMGEEVIGVLSLHDIPEEYRVMQPQYRRWKSQASAVVAY